MNTLKNVTAALILTAVSLNPAIAQVEGAQLNFADKASLQSLSDGIEPATFREVDPTMLARFELSNGNEVRFYGVPEDGELLIGEITDVGREQFLIDPEASPAEIFLELAPADLPVPKMIAETDEELFKWHPKVDALAESVAVEVAAPVGALAKAGSGSCATGNAGAVYFEDHHCNTLGGPGYGSSEAYCYDGASNAIQKTSSSRRRATYTRMASCGSGTNHLRHFYSTTSGYHTQLNIYVAPQKVVNYWSAKTGAKRYRRVRFEESNSAGWVRGWVKYHSEVAGGWF